MWQERNQALIKEFTFPDFKSALTFVNEVGGLAEAANHHPDISLSWDRVIISLTTHDEGGVTEKDRKLATSIDDLEGTD
jgi:4a-hydroxytetrahydrobiopterin dehydratase